MPDALGCKNNPLKAQSDIDILPYWFLYCRIKQIKVCRMCGKILSRDYLKRRRGKLCFDCCLADSLGIDVRTIDIDTLYYL